MSFISTGKLLTRISTKNRDISDLHIAGSILVVSDWSSNGQVKFYQLEWRWTKWLWFSNKGQ